MSSALKGKVYDPLSKSYVDEFPETTAPAPSFAPVEARRRVEAGELPTSPRGAYKAALAAGWEVVAWLTVGEQSPTLYLSDSEEDDANQYSKGDIRYDGYRASIYVIEARVSATVPIGFRAFYLGKDYGAGDKRNKPGSFDCAFVADPVGTVQVLDHTYKPIPVTRGRDQAGRVVETEASFKANQARMQKMADDLNAQNDGSFILNRRPMFAGAKEFTTWIAEWASYGRLSNV